MRVGKWNGGDDVAHPFAVVGIGRLFGHRLGGADSDPSFGVFLRLFVAGYSVRSHRFCAPGCASGSVFALRLNSLAKLLAEADFQSEGADAVLALLGGITDTEGIEVRQVGIFLRTFE